MKRVGYLGSCLTPYCGSIDGYFCGICRHYVEECLCSGANCQCPSDIGWASVGERQLVMGQALDYLGETASAEQALTLHTVTLLPLDTVKQRVEAHKALYELSCAIQEGKVKK